MSIHPSEPKPGDKPIVCPAWLSLQAKREWRRLAPELKRLGVLTHLDRDALATYCTAVVHYRQAAELTALAEADPTFARVTLKAWKYGQLLQTSSELLSDSSISIETFLAEDTGRSLGRAIGSHYVSGTGTTQPLGVTTGAGTGVSGGTGVVGVPTGDDLIDLVHSVSPPYRNGACWLMHDSTVGKVRKLKTTGGGDYVWQPSFREGQPDLLLGYPVFTEPNMPAAGTGVMSIYFGNLNRGYVIRDVSTLRFERSDDYAFANDLVTFRAVMRTDGTPLDRRAIRGFKGAAS